MAVVTITTMTKYWCACGNLFGLSTWPVPDWQIATMPERACKQCGEIHYDGRLFARVERPEH